MKTHIAILLMFMTGCANARYDPGLSLERYCRATDIPGLPLIAQSDEYQCGYACMATVALYYDIPPKELISKALRKNFGARALSGKDLIEMAKALGLKAYAYEGDTENLLENLKKRRPIITLLNHPPRTGNWPTYQWAHETAEQSLIGAHWVVVTGLTPERDILIHDPRRGRLRMSAKEFTCEWNLSSCLSVLIDPPST